MYKKEQDFKPQTPQHEDFERNKLDAKKLKEFWEPKLEDHRSKIRFHLGADTLYLSYNRVIGGEEYVHSSPHSYSQSWPEFRGSVTGLFRYCEVLGIRNDRNASGEWKRRFGIKVTPDGNSHAELFLH